MEFTINRVYFMKKLEELQKVISTKTHISILAGMKVVLDENFLVITSGNSDVFLELTIPKTDEEAGLQIKTEGSSVLMTSNLIVQFLKKSNHEKVSLAVIDDHLQLKSGRAKLNKGATDSVIQYPTLPSFANSKSFTIKGFDLKKIISRTIFAASTSEARPVLTGVKFSFLKDKLELIATDSHRLSKLEHDTIKSEEESTIVVPSKTLKDFLSIVDDEKDILTQMTGQYISFSYENFVYIGRLLEGKYPDTSRLIPVNAPIKIKVNRKSLIDSVSLISVAESTTEIVRINATKGSNIIELSSMNSETGNIQDELECISYEGESVLISLKTKYVLDALKQFETDEVILCIHGSVRPVTIESESEKNNIQLILPIRTH